LLALDGPWVAKPTDRVLQKMRMYALTELSVQALGWPHYLSDGPVKAGLTKALMVFYGLTRAVYPTMICAPGYDDYGGVEAPEWMLRAGNVFDTTIWCLNLWWTWSGLKKALFSPVSDYLETQS
jgi:hypothetical protein